MLKTTRKTISNSFPFSNHKLNNKIKKMTYNNNNNNNYASQQPPGNWGAPVNTTVQQLSQQQLTQQGSGYYSNSSGGPSPQQQQQQQFTPQQYQYQQPPQQYQSQPPPPGAYHIAPPSSTHSSSHSTMGSASHSSSSSAPSPATSTSSSGSGSLMPGNNTNKASPSGGIHKSMFLVNEKSAAQPPFGNQDQKNLEREAAKGWRRTVFEWTDDCVKKGWYKPYRDSHAKPVGLPPVDIDNVFPVAADRMKKLSPTTTTTQQQKLRIVLYRGDCLHAARDLFSRAGEPPLVMVAGNATKIGGGAKNGAMAQEEDICRRSNYLHQVDPSLGFQKHSKHLHPIPAGAGILTENAVVFRDDASTNYAFLPSPFLCDFGVVCAPNRPELTQDGMMVQSAADEVMASLRTFFKMATSRGKTKVVPIPLGAGAFACPASHIARLMMVAIDDECMKSCVDEVRISIIDDHNAFHKFNPEGNFLPFCRAALQYFGDSQVIIVDGPTGADIKPEMIQKTNQPPPPVHVAPSPSSSYSHHGGMSSMTPNNYSSLSPTSVRGGHSASRGRASSSFSRYGTGNRGNTSPVYNSRSSNNSANRTSSSSVSSGGGSKISSHHGSSQPTRFTSTTLSSANNRRF